MGELEEKVKILYENCICPVCLRHLDNYGHEACEVLCGLDEESARTKLSRKKMQNYQGDWNKLIQLALYSQFIPWGTTKDGLGRWFDHIEKIITHLENQDVAVDTSVIQILEHLSEDLYSLPSIAKQSRYPRVKDLFDRWKIEEPLTPLDFYCRSKQVSDDSSDLGLLQPQNAIERLYRILGMEPRATETAVSAWINAERLDRKILYHEGSKKVVSARSYNDRVLVSSLFSLSGHWQGWVINDLPLKAPSLQHSAPRGLVSKDRITVPWSSVKTPKVTEKDLKFIIARHGKEALGTSNPQTADPRAPKSNLQIVEPGKPGLIDELDPIPESTSTILSYEKETSISSDEDLFDKGVALIKKYTRFYTSTCPEQARAIAYICTHPNTLVQTIMPTGSGKSLIPLCVAEHTYENDKDAIVVVICPLISLLNDQVQNARRDAKLPEFKSVNRVACLHSSVGTAEFANSLKAVRDGACSLLYVTAEQLQSERILRTICNRKVAWVFIDEGHGIVEFENYRPAYYRIWYPIRRMKSISPEMGLEIQTATMPKEWTQTVWTRLLKSIDVPVIKEFKSKRIRDNLNFHEPILFDAGGGVDRNNRSIDKAIESARSGRRTILYTLYLQTENYFVEMYRRVLEKAGSKVRVGCFSSENSRIQNRNVDKNTFVVEFSKGNLDLVLATMAFGLGIDRGDVRTIVLNGLPSSLNTIYQQAGRAGRAIDERGTYIYTADIYIYAEVEQDIQHQRYLNSFSNLYGTTTTRFLENMLLSSKSDRISDGLCLLDLEANNICEEKSAKSSSSKNSSSLRILSELGIIEWVASLPERIIIDNAACENLLGSDIDPRATLQFEKKIEIETSYFLKKAMANKRTGLIDCYELIRDISARNNYQDVEWAKGRNLALVAWLKKIKKEEIEEMASDWKADQTILYDEELKQIFKFLDSKNNREKMKLLSEYYGLS